MVTQIEVITDSPTSMIKQHQNAFLLIVSETSQTDRLEFNPTFLRN